jgi:hypothetical protein
MPTLTSRQRLLRVVLLACVALAACLPLLKNLLPSIPSVPCGFKAFTGLPCLFCGGTRAASAALRGDFEYSLYLNTLSIPVLVAIMLFASVCAWEIFRGRPIAHWDSISRPCIKILPLVLVLLLAWWSLHMLSALQTPKPELLNPDNPIAARLRALLLH